jgi:ribosomal protein L13
MKSAAGEMQQNELSKRLKVYKGWKNAHHIQNIAVNKLEDDVLI